MVRVSDLRATVEETSDWEGEVWDIWMCRTPRSARRKTWELPVTRTFSWVAIVGAEKTSVGSRWRGLVWLDVDECSARRESIASTTGMYKEEALKDLDTFLPAG